VRAREVAVVGAGIVGAATARELAVRGADVVLLDSGDVSSGTTGLGEGNVLCSDKDAGPELELCVHGLELYDELEERLGAEARVRRKGALIVHPEAGTWAAEPARLERLRAAGVHGALVAADDVVALEPELTGEVRGASFFEADLQCDPRAIARALAREAEEAGAEVRTGARVVEIAQGVVLAGGERIGAGAVVIAAGPWSAALAEQAGVRLPLEPRKGQLVRLATTQGGSDPPYVRGGSDPPYVAAGGLGSAKGGLTPLIRHKVVDGSYLASVMSGDAGLEVTSVVETTWDGDVLVGSSRERRGFDTTVDDAVSDAMVARAARLFPRLAGLPRTTAWAGLRPWLPDHLPAIGASRAAEGLWLATGHEGAGVALGPITGRLVAQAYCGEPSPVELAPFDPDRFGR
jgi:D-hydroxyproline dehydrogenase subunit beta